GPGSDQNRRKFIDPAASEYSNHILSHELLNVRIETIEWAEARKQNHVRWKLIASYRHHKHRAHVATQHSACCEFRDRTFEILIDDFGRPGWGNISENTENICGGIDIRDATASQSQFQTALPSPADDQLMELLIGTNEFSRACRNRQWCAYRRILRS